MRGFFMLDSIPLSPEFVTAATAQTPVAGLTHDFYRYPARFSPELARAAIQEFTAPDDTVVDPFMGAGTSLVEALSHKRNCIGSDINELAVFVAKVKTRPLNTVQRTRVLHLIKSLSQASLAILPKTATTWRNDKYLRNLHSRKTWPIRDSIGLALARLESLPTAPEQHFFRCVLLRTAQWAVDGRRILPSAAQFRHRLLQTATRMLDSLVDFCAELSPHHKVLILHQPAEELSRRALSHGFRAPSLILTSPPYPGVHVLYHRWQLLGGLETPAAFWIANCKDGEGASHYTFGDHRTHTETLYFDTLKRSFESIASIAQPNTLFVQVVGFSNPRSQLARYLATLSEAGLAELLPRWKGQKTKRLWRRVPNRRWYNSRRVGLSSEREVVLFHRLTP